MANDRVLLVEAEGSMGGTTQAALEESKVAFDTSTGHWHRDGDSRPIPDATSLVKGEATPAQITKLDGIAAGADVTGSNAPQAHAASHTDASDDIQSAGLAQKGIVELATAAETTTGTDAGRAVTPDGLAGSDYGKRVMLIKLIDEATALAIGDGKFIFVVPAILNGWNLVGVEAHVTTVSSSGLPTYSIYNLTDSVDMLSTSITIDANEYTSATAATPPAINGATDDVATGDRIEVNKDVAGTGEKGDEVLLVFQLP